MRYIDDGFIEYEVQQAKAKREQVAESLQSVRYLTEIRDEHERLNFPVPKPSVALGINTQ